MATRLIIMRHAKSIFLDGLHDDFERPLDKQGQKDAIMIGNQLLSLGWKCSWTGPIQNNGNVDSVNKNNGNTKSNG